MRVRGFASIFLACSALSRMCGDAVAADYYSGKTLTIIVGSDVGGGYDAYARLLSRHLARFVPGVAAIANMPGAGSPIATDDVAKVAAKEPHVHRRYLARRPRRAALRPTRIGAIRTRKTAIPRQRRQLYAHLRYVGLRLVTAQPVFSGPFLLAPGMRDEPLSILRNAFAAAMQDPAFAADAAKLGTSGSDAPKRVVDMYQAPPQLVARAKEILAH